MIILTNWSSPVVRLPDAGHVMGTTLLVGFLFLVGALATRMHVLLADVLAVGVYIGLGYVASRVVDSGQIYLVAGMYFIGWVGFLRYLKSAPPIIAISSTPSSIPLLLKWSVVASLCYALMEAAGLLVGIVVTFPFSGVFTVIEMRDNLRTLATTFARTSGSIVAYFLMVHAIGDLWLGIPAGLVVYLAMIQVTNRFMQKWLWNLGNKCLRADKISLIASNSGGWLFIYFLSFLILSEKRGSFANCSARSLIR